MQQCERKYNDFCKGVAEGEINGKPVCNGCRWHGEDFD